ncbi:MAG TPA: cytochrome c biogenesis protein CcsA [Coriobacteriia bacterium]
MPATMPAATDIASLTSSVGAVGRPFGAVLAVAALAYLAAALVPAWRAWGTRALAVLVGLLVAGEATLVWFHVRLWQLAVVVDPVTGQAIGRVAVPPWVESEKLYVWALALGVLLLCARRHSDELRRTGSILLLLLVVGALVSGRPFTDPLPDFLAQYGAYLRAMGSGSAQAASGAFQGMAGSMTYYYNAWYMWVHPPLLFLSYGAFALSFLAALQAAWHRRASFEKTAYRWARFGYLPLTAGMLLGLPWAILAWTGEAWWWSGKVNMSIMMWLLYTAYLHLRLYLPRRGMWRWVLGLAFVSFAALVLTYVTTYVVPGAHSVA